MVKNDMPTLRAQLTEALYVERWVDDVMRLGPFGSAAALEAAARHAFPLTHAELTAALDTHPKIGERASKAGLAAEFSDAEQAASAVDAADAVTALDVELADGNAAYEAKFGHVFLIRAAGRSRQDIVDQLRERLDHSAATERNITEQQLEEITLLRVAAIAKGLSDD